MAAREWWLSPGETTGWESCTGLSVIVYGTFTVATTFAAGGAGFLSIAARTAICTAGGRGSRRC